MYYGGQGSECEVTLTCQGDAILVLTRMRMTESERLKEVEDELKAMKEKEDAEVEWRIGEMRVKMMADMRKEEVRRS